MYLFFKVTNYLVCILEYVPYHVVAPESGAKKCIIITAAQSAMLVQ